MVDYNKTLVEVDEILNYLSEEDLLKIPEKVRNTIKENKDKEYVWKYDETKTLKEQDVSRDTIAFLAYLNVEYLLNKEQKELMEKIYDLNDKKSEKEKKSKYSKELFDDKKIIKSEDKKNEITIYKTSFFSKILNKISRMFGSY